MSEVGRFSCDEVLRRLDDYVDRALGSVDLRLIEEHLADCLACAAAVRFEASLIDGIRSRLQRIDLPRELRETIHARLITETTNRDGRRGLPSGGP